MNFIRRSYLINFRSLKHLSTFEGKNATVLPNKNLRQEAITDTDLGGTSVFLNIREFAGVEKFIKHREKSKLLIKKPTEYLTNLEQASSINNDSIVFCEDIKNIVTLAETDKDILLLEKVLLKFSLQKNIVQYNPFSFGPQIMRLLYIKNKPHKALELVKNPNFVQYFKHETTALLLVDLLFNNNMYHSVIEMYEYLGKNGERRYSNNVKLYFFAACYRANTEKYVEKAKAVWYSDVQGYKPPLLRIRLLFTILLLNQNKCPFDVISCTPTTYFLSLTENIKYMVLARGNRFWDFFNAIEDVMNSENVKRFLLTQETLSFIEKELHESTEDNIVRFHKIKQKLIENDLVTHEPLDTFLLGDMSMGKDSFQDLRIKTRLHDAIVLGLLKKLV